MTGLTPRFLELPSGDSWSWQSGCSRRFAMGGVLGPAHFLLAPNPLILSNLPFTMKKILLPLLLALASAMPAHAQNILVVDVSNVFNNLFELKTEMNKLKVTTDSYSNFLQQQGQALAAMQQKANELEAQSKNPANLPDSQKLYEGQWYDQLTAIDNKKKEIQQFYNQSSDLVNKKQQEIVQIELDKMKTVVKDLATKQKASFVFNSSPLGMISSVIYSSDDKSIDITDTVLKSMNDKFIAEGGVAPAATPATMPTPAATLPATPAMAAPTLTPAPAMGSAKPAASGK